MQLLTHSYNLFGKNNAINLPVTFIYISIYYYVIYIILPSFYRSNVDIPINVCPLYTFFGIYLNYSCEGNVE